jgi:hypothetical protein
MAINIDKTKADVQNIARVANNTEDFSVLGIKIRF